MIFLFFTYFCRATPVISPHPGLSEKQLGRQKKNKDTHFLPRNAPLFSPRKDYPPLTHLHLQNNSGWLTSPSALLDITTEKISKFTRKRARVRKTREQKRERKTYGDLSRDSAQWFRTAKNRDVSTGPPARAFACSLAPLTHLLAPPCSLHSCTLLRSLVCLLTHSLARGTMND